MARAPDRKIAAAREQVSFYLEMISELLICINEIRINRSVEPETRVRHREPVGRPRSRSREDASLTYGPIELDATGPLRRTT